MEYYERVTVDLLPRHAFHVGQRVSWKRANGDPLQGEIVKLRARDARIRPFELTGRGWIRGMNDYLTWRVPYEQLQAVTPPPSPAAASNSPATAPCPAEPRWACLIGDWAGGFTAYGPFRRPATISDWKQAASRHEPVMVVSLETPPGGIRACAGGPLTPHIIVTGDFRVGYRAYGVFDGRAHAEDHERDMPHPCCPLPLRSPGILVRTPEGGW